MRQMIGLVAATAATLLLLTGCASTPEASASTATKQPVETSAEAAPRITAPPADETESGEAALLDRVREFRAVPILDSATDEQVISAARDACAQLTAGTRLIDVTVIDGDDPAKEGTLLAKTAHEYLCPDAPMDMDVTP